MGSPATAMLVFGLLILAGTTALFLCGGVYATLGNISFRLFLPIALAAAVGLATAICLIGFGLTLPRLSSSQERVIGQEEISSGEFEAAKRRVRGPALAMLLVALLNCLPFIVVFFSDGDAVFFSEPIWFIMFTTLPVVVTSCLVIFGAICMRDLRWYGLAVAASVLVLVPCHYAFALGIPVGIWALTVLMHADTRKAFQARAGQIVVVSPGKSGPIADLHPAWTPLPFVLACALVPVVLTVALFALRLWSTTRSTDYSPPKDKKVIYETTKAEEGGTPIPPEAVTWGATGPQLGPRLRLNSMFSQEQLEKLDAALAKTYQEYLVAERDHTARKTNELGHSVITITTFPKEMGEIENRFWTEADAIVTDNTSRGTLRDALKFPGDIFRFGHVASTIEMWRSGTWYYVKSGGGSDYSWPELPRIYQGLWQPPEPEKKQ